MTNKKLISFIIPVWIEDPKELLVQNLIRSIFEFCDISFELILIFNTNEEIILKQILKDSRIDKYCINNMNVGVSRAWNMGAQMAEGDLLCFANQDVEIGPNLVKTLAEKIRTTQDIGIIGLEGANIQMSEYDISTTIRITKGSPQYCNVVSGFFFLVKKNIFDIVGGFDNELSPCFFEEIDFSIKVAEFGYKSFIIPNLNYQHNWGVSSAKKNKTIKYFSNTEKLSDIYNRNRETILRKWSTSNKVFTPINYEGDYYGGSYFKNYQDVMLNFHMVNEVNDPPLVITLFEMVKSVSYYSKIKVNRILDIGCSLGFLVKTLVENGFDAFGIDFSSYCVNETPIKDRIKLADVREISENEKFDLVISTNLFEHLSELDSSKVIKSLSKITETVFTIINKSPHDPSHINIKSNNKWVEIFKENGFWISPSLTNRARNIYKNHSKSLSENWHYDTLIFIKKGNNNRPKNQIIFFIQEFSIELLMKIKKILSLNKFRVLNKFKALKRKLL